MVDDIREHDSTIEVIPDRIGKYIVHRLLGRGGMGWVYLAEDPDLHRTVALKTIPIDSADRVERFIREARAQARVRHPHVVQVYEVGTVEGWMYIAMQYVPGKTLRDAAPEMTLEEKLIVIRDVAEALHAAHTQGLVHRDIKPTNVLVERTGDGRWVPYVADFGLVHIEGEPGLTTSGTAIGTPHYMAPEQVRGKHAQIDRRTDVYGLGATLYEILTATPPFAPASVPEILLHILTRDVTPPRTINPAIPEDVETIVLKCMEKEPHRRYESARALAEDITRYLRGEPIRARRPSAMYRFRKLVRRHRALVITIVVALIVAVALFTAYFRQRLLARQRAALATAFGERIQMVDTLLWQVHLAPAHDIRYAYRWVRSYLDTIRDEIRRLGSVARGPGYYALGRGYMTLGMYAEARKALQQAWYRENYRTPDVALAMSRTLIELYRAAYHRIMRIGQTSERERRLRELDRQYRASIREFMRHVGNVREEDRAYVEALLAFLDRKYGIAQTRAQQAVRARPWFYPAHVLLGDIALQMANDARDRGDRDRAGALYQNAYAYYATAARVGESDPQPYIRICQWAGDVARFRAMQTGGALDPVFRTGRRACATALHIFPGHVDAHLWQARLLWRWGQYRMRTGRDPRHLFERARYHAEIAMRRAPKLATPYKYVAHIRAFEGLYARRIGREDTAKTFMERALQFYRKALQYDPNDATIFNNMGNVLDLLAEMAGDERVQQRYQRESIRNYMHTVRLNPQYPGIYTNLVSSYYSLAMQAFVRGADPRGALQRALQYGRKAVDLNPYDSYAMSNLGLIHTVWARYAMTRGQDPEPHLAEAVRILDRAASINPDYAYIFSNRAEAYTFWAIEYIRRGRSPSALLQKALADIARALRIDPNDAALHYTHCWIHMQRAYWTVLQNESPDPMLRSARMACQQVLRLQPGNTNAAAAFREMAVLTFWYDLLNGRDGVRGQRSTSRTAASDLIAVKQHVLRAIATLRAGRDPIPSLQPALDMLQQLPDAGMEVSDVLLWRIRAHRLAAWWALRTADVNTARMHMTRSITLADRLLRIWPDWLEARAEGLWVVRLYARISVLDPSIGDLPASLRGLSGLDTVLDVYPGLRLFDHDTTADAVMTGRPGRGAFRRPGAGQSDDAREVV